MDLSSITAQKGTRLSGKETKHVFASLQQLRSQCLSVVEITEPERLQFSLASLINM